MKKRTKTLKVGKHTTECFNCFDMCRRGYGSSMKEESKYWDDFFAHTERPITVKIVYRGREIWEDEVFKNMLEADEKENT